MPQSSPVSKKKERQEEAPAAVTITASDPNLHYASLPETPDDAYPEPWRVDSFIAKLTRVNGAYTITLRDSVPCGNGLEYKACLMIDTKATNIFGRLLQVACCYDNVAPGYFLNCSPQQLFFSLEDKARRLKHLWIAERIFGGCLLIYCARAPKGTDITPEIYQQYKEQVERTVMNTSHF